MTIFIPVYDATMWPASTTINEWTMAKKQPHIWSDKALKHDVNLEFLNFTSADARIGKNRWKSPHLIRTVFNPRPKFLNCKFIANHNFFLTHLWNFVSLNKEYNCNIQFCHFISCNYLGQTASSYIFWTMDLCIVLVGNQLDAQFLLWYVSLTLRRLMSYIYIYIYIYIYRAPILDVSRSHTTTQHSR